MGGNCKDTKLVDRVHDSWILNIYAVVLKKIIHALSSSMDKSLQLTPGPNWKTYLTFNLVKLGFCSRKTNHRKNTNESILSLSRQISEPQAEVRKILANHCVHQYFVKIIDRSGNRNSAYREKLMYACKWKSEKDYFDKFGCANRAAVYVTIHMGYTEAMFLRVFSSSPSKKYSMIVQSINDQLAFENTQRFTRSIGLDISLIETSDSKKVRKAVRQLRKGELSLGVYCDLPGSFGKSASICFLGKKAQIVIGPAKIAVLGRVPIIPVFCFIRNHIPHIEMHAPIHTHRSVDESVDEAAKRITQSMHRVSERVIRRHPEQWLYLDKIQNFYQPSKERL